MAKTPEISRREFLSLAGGLLVLVTAPRAVLEAARAAGLGQVEEINAWLLIAADNKVTAFAGKVEMGEGIRTSFAQMVAEELTVPPSSVEMIIGDTARVPYDRGTFGSLSTRTVGRTLMAAAARARETLVQLAAERWGAKPDQLVVRDGRISMKTDAAKSVTLGELTQGKHIVHALPGEPRLIPFAEHETIGKPLHRVDGPAIVTGEEKFVGDLRMPGMAYAVLLYPPSFGAELVSVHKAEAEKLPGVVGVVREDDLIGVIAERQDIAERARSLIRATWRETTQPAQSTLYDDLRRTGKPEGTVVDDPGVASALAAARATFRSSYRTAYLAHAPIEPHVALVSVEADGVKAWVSAQTPFPHRDEIAEALGVDSTKVHVIVPRVGGGFGGKERADLAVAAARLSRAVKRPVLLSQNRAEEMTWNYFKPAALIDVRCGVDGSGRVQAWESDIYNCGGRGAEPPYGFPKRVRTLECDAPLDQGAWRGLAGSANTFAIECHIDEMAARLGVDPVEFRLRHLENDPRLASAVKAAAEKYGWKSRAGQSGRGVGFACASDAGSRVAEIVEIELERTTGVMRVNRIVAAMECGWVINPNGLTNQIQGAITMGLGMALREAVRYENGKILTDSFASYRIPTIKDTPVIESVLVENASHPPEGAGEPPIFPVAAAVANAFFDLTGKRIREIPLSPESVSAALKE